MARVIRCRDLGFDCDGLVREESEEAALAQVARHASSAHGIDEMTPEIVEKVKSVMREE